MIYSLKKSERISKKNDIALLFESGLSFKAFPLRAVYLERTKTAGSQPAVSIMVSVPKKKFKHAVDRNRLKRLVREAYRLNKEELLNVYKDNESELLITFLYVEKELSDYPTVEKAVKQILSSLVQLKS